ncbi:MAG: HD domain-containing protein [bacterium]|nr:HD domain-containing protein [bacterium]
MQWKEFKSHISHLSAKDQKRINKAFEMGTEAHKCQNRKSGEPYFTHPIAVAHILADMGADADTLIAALLHDTVEDTDLTLLEIDDAFNGQVSALIDGVTKIYREDLEGRPTLDDQIETLRKIFRLMKQDVRIMVIKLVDRLHNMQTVEFMKPERQKTFAQETMDVFVKIADRLAMNNLRDEMEALCLSVLEPGVFEELSELRIENEKQSEKIIRKMCKHLQDVLGKTHVDCVQEIKSWQKLRISMESGDKGITGVAALTATFICSEINDCYQVLGALHQIWQREHLSFQDYINSPMMNGYRGVHTTVILEDGTRVRCKIRTEAMQEYHKYGITVSCFDSEASGVFDYLPWADHIKSLTEDTEDRSDDFWESLQSDILGDSIIVHGMNDHTEMLPEGSTALDGVFFCFRNHAQFTKSIRINGEEVALHTPLRNGVSLDVTFAKSEMIDRQWLEWVNTGLATAVIRSALSTTSKKKKLTIGKDLLQDIMTEQNKGFLEEYDNEKFSDQLASQGYRTLNDAFIAIANGYIKPEHMFSVLFEPIATEQNVPSRVDCIVHFTMQIDDADIVAQVIGVYKEMGITLKNVRFRPRQLFHGNISLGFPLSSTEQKLIVQRLQKAGATDISVHPKRASFHHRLMFLLLIVLWGMDPVFAHQILINIAKPEELIFLRYFTFFIAASLLYVHQVITSKRKYKALDIRRTSLFLSGIAFFLTGALSYYSLQYLSPVQYIIFIVIGTVIVPMLRRIFSKDSYTNEIIMMCVSLLTSAFMMKLYNTPAIALLFGLGSGLSFGWYSEVGRRYQEQEGMIQARYPAFLFCLSCLSLIPALIYVPNMYHTLLTPAEISTIIAFILTFVFLPYTLFYILVRQIESHQLYAQLLLVCLFAAVGEIIFTRSISPIAILPVFVSLVWWNIQEEKRRKAT